MSEAETEALSYYPFEGDRDVNPTRFSDKFVRAAKEHVCHICHGPIAKGERHRALTEGWDGQVGTFRFCALCCDAMAAHWTWTAPEDDFRAEDPLTARYSLGFERRGRA